MFLVILLDRVLNVVFNVSTLIGRSSCRNEEMIRILDTNLEKLEDADCDYRLQKNDTEPPQPISGKLQILGRVFKRLKIQVRAKS